MLTAATLLTALAGLLLLFKPLLVGLARAGLLVLKPRLSKEERRARRAQRDAQLLQKIINRAQGPNDAAELRALAARG